MGEGEARSVGERAYLTRRRSYEWHAVREDWSRIEVRGGDSGAFLDIGDLYHRLRERGYTVWAGRASPVETDDDPVPRVPRLAAMPASMLTRG
jgi:hypothetical protein